MAEENLLIKCLHSKRFLEATENSTRLVRKLKLAVEDNQYYETHQILRTINSRFINNSEKVLALKSLLYNGAIHLIESGEPVSGQDIASLFVECSAKYLKMVKKEPGITHSDRHTALSDIEREICTEIASILTKLPDTEIGAQKFLADALKNLPINVLDRERLHERLADEFRERKNFVNSRYHYLRCANDENAEKIAKFLIDYHAASGTKDEIDLFIVQFVMQYLCLQNPIDRPTTANKIQMPGILPKTRSLIRKIASSLFNNYKSHIVDIQNNNPQKTYPLLNFLYFIILLLDLDGKESIFTTICDVYREACLVDPNYQSYLTRIGNIYHGIRDPSEQRQNGPGGGLFNNILMSLFDGADDEDTGSQHDGNTILSSDELD